MKIKLVSLNTKNFVSSIAFMLHETILIFFVSSICSYVIWYVIEDNRMKT